MLKFNERGQWTLIKHRVLAPSQGGVQADVPRPEVGQRGHQGKMLAVADDGNRPKPKEIRMGGTDDKNTMANPTSIPADRANNFKRFGPNGERID